MFAQHPRPIFDMTCAPKDPAHFSSPLLDGEKIQHCDVAALLYTADSKYLLQLRDNNSSLKVPDHWALFGGRVELGETPSEALRRELKEELEFNPSEMRLFTEMMFRLPQLGVGVTHKSFFEVPIEVVDIKNMILHEGAASVAVCGAPKSEIDPEYRQPRFRDFICT